MSMHDHISIVADKYKKIGLPNTMRTYCSSRGSITLSYANLA